ncbi:MAG: tRNA dihydrouridine synthase DusB, partial [Flavobacteriales bacterium]
KKHLKMSLEWKGEREGIVEMRRHYSNYFKGIRDFKPVRMKLVTSMESEEIFETLENVKTEFSAFL